MGENSNKREAAIKRAGRAVVQYDLKGNEIARYRSIGEAARATGLQVGNISQVCQGKRKQSGGYKWEYDSCVVVRWANVYRNSLGNYCIGTRTYSSKGNAMSVPIKDYVATVRLTWEE